MLGSSMIVLGMFLAFNASLTAVRTAPDRVFAVAALAVTICEALVILFAVAWTTLQPV